LNIRRHDVYSPIVRHGDAYSQTSGLKIHDIHQTPANPAEKNVKEWQ